MCLIPVKALLPKKFRSCVAFDVVPTFTCISSDQYIESYARKKCISYADAFKSQAKLAMKVAMDEFKEALSLGDELIVIDQTNLSIPSRRRKMEMIPRDSSYVCEAMVFPFRSWYVMEQLIEYRKKVIPRDVLMQQHFDMLIPKVHRYRSPLEPSHCNDENFEAVWLLDDHRKENYDIEIEGCSEREVSRSVYR